MNRLILAFFISLVLAEAQNPQPIQVVSTPNIGNTGQNIVASGHATLVLPRPTQPGNAIVIAWWAPNGSGSMTPSDNQSNTYSSPAGASCSDTNSGQTIHVAYALDIAANTRVLQVATANAVAWFGAVAMEVTNIATSEALDTSSCNAPNATMTTVSAGSFTPATSGDFLFEYYFNTNANSSTAITEGSQSNITWRLASSLFTEGTGSQWGVYNSTSAINPTMSQMASGATGTVAAAIALKPSLAGSGPPSGMYIYAVHGETIQPGTSSPYILQKPITGNLVVDMFDGGGADCVTAISSSPSNTWNNTGACHTDSSTHVSVVGWYSAAPSTSNERLNMTFTSATSGGSDNHIFYDIVGAASSPFDTEAATDGYQTGTGSFNTITITPTNSDGIVLASVGVDFDTIDGTTTTGALFQNGWLSSNTVGNTFYYNNNGRASYANSSSSPITFGWTVMSGLGTNVAIWDSMAAAFKAPATVGTQGAANACDLNADGVVDVLDVQLAINMYLGSITCTADIDGLDVCNTDVVNAVVTAALGGACVVTSTHSAALNWTASSSSNIAGYNIYRSATSSGTYTKLNTSLVVPTSYADNSVQAGQTYFYVATAVDTSGTESVYSSPPQQAVIPTP